MSINRDPDGKPTPTDEMIDEARKLGLQIVNVVCNEQGARVGDPTGVSFFAMVPSVPHPGDRIELEDGRMCEVRRVYWRVIGYPDPTRKARLLALIPNIAAFALDKQD